MSFLIQGLAHPEPKAPDYLKTGIVRGPRINNDEVDQILPRFANIPLKFEHKEHVIIGKIRNAYIHSTGDIFIIGIIDTIKYPLAQSIVNDILSQKLRGLSIRSASYYDQNGFRHSSLIPEEVSVVANGAMERSVITSIGNLNGITNFLKSSCQVYKMSTVASAEFHQEEVNKLIAETMGIKTKEEAEEAKKILTDVKNKRDKEMTAAVEKSIAFAAKMQPDSVDEFGNAMQRAMSSQFGPILISTLASAVSGFSEFESKYLAMLEEKKTEEAAREAQKAVPITVAETRQSIAASSLDPSEKNRQIVENALNKYKKSRMESVAASADVQAVSASQLEEMARAIKPVVTTSTIN